MMLWPGRLPLHRIKCRECGARIDPAPELVAKHYADKHYSILINAYNLALENRLTKIGITVVDD